jgi:hypothetical protein
MTNMRKLELAWKYRRPLWKYRNVIRHRWDILAGAVCAGAAATLFALRPHSPRGTS